MPTHVNEAATSGGGVQSGTRVERIISNVASSADVVVPISNVTRAFDGPGRCIGCRRHVIHMWHGGILDGRHRFVG